MGWCCSEDNDRAVISGCDSVLKKPAITHQIKNTFLNELLHIAARLLLVDK